MEGDEMYRGEESSKVEKQLRDSINRGIGRKASIVAGEHPEASIKYYSDRLPFLPLYRSYSGGDLTVTWRMWDRDLKKQAEQNPEDEILVGGEHRREVTYEGDPVYRDTAEFPRFRRGGSGENSHFLRFKGQDGLQRYHKLTPIGSRVDVELYEPGGWEEELDRLYHEIREGS